GGLVNYIVNNERWNSDPFFREYLLNYTNAATLIREDFKDAEDLDGVFSGLMEYSGNTKNWPYDGFVGQYQTDTWQYARHGGEFGEPRGGAELAAPGRRKAQQPPHPGEPLQQVIRSLRKPAPLHDETLRHPRCVLQVVKRHFSRYTPEMVEQVTGCPKATFLEVAEAILENSGRDRTTAWTYAVGWTQHTYGPQMIGCCA